MPTGEFAWSLYTPRQAATYAISISYDNYTEIADSPHAITVHAGLLRPGRMSALVFARVEAIAVSPRGICLFAALSPYHAGLISPTHCNITWPGPLLTANSPYVAPIYAHDQDDNFIDCAIREAPFPTWTPPYMFRGNFSFAFPSTAPTDTSIHCNASTGAYMVSFTPHTAGPHQAASVFWEDAHIIGSPHEFEIIPGPISALHSFVVWPDLNVVSLGSTLFILARDLDGNNISCPIRPWECANFTLHGAPIAANPIVRCAADVPADNETWWEAHQRAHLIYYRLDFTPWLSGSFDVNVRYAGDPIANATVSVGVLPRPLSPVTPPKGEQSSARDAGKGEEGGSRGKTGGDSFGRLLERNGWQGVVHVHSV